MLSSRLKLIAAALAAASLACNLLGPRQTLTPSLTPAPFQPSSDTQLDGGDYTFTSLNIPANTVVTVASDAVITVTGDVEIAGILTGDCVEIKILGQGSVSITGTVDNQCASDPTQAADLVIQTDGGNLTIGTADTPATINTSGNLELTNAPDLQEWEFDVLPDQRSSTPLPPVCSARAGTIWDTVIPGSTFEVAFFGEGADPDGGPVSYQWDFGDAASSTDQSPLHAYASSGAFDVVLTVTDDEAETCQAALRIVMDDGEANIPAAPALWAGPTELVAAAGQEVFFTSNALDPQGQDLAFQWDFGDAAGSTEPHPSHIYNSPGRYLVTLTVTDPEGNFSTATSSVYVYSASTTAGISPVSLDLPSRAPDDCADPTFNLGSTKPKAGLGQPGQGIRFIGRGDVFIEGLFKAGDGGDGQSRVGIGYVRGDDGKQGGSLEILVQGRLTICPGAELASGDGGKGGDATATAPPGGTATARAGDGGSAGAKLRIYATQGLEFKTGAFGGSVVLAPGSGGDGGEATAVGDTGPGICPRGEDGARGVAVGGDGGKASKLATVTGEVNGLENVEVVGAQGGSGGRATAVGGDGGAADCPGAATGGHGKPGEARGGRGGEATVTGAIAMFGAVAPNAFTAGDGGDAQARGGWGGDAEATPPAACQAATATGGKGGLGKATGGDGGAGRIQGEGGEADATGGQGGRAKATGGDCADCGNGGGATATAGPGGDAVARGGAGRAAGGSVSNAITVALRLGIYTTRGSVLAAEGAASATGGYGGEATANGGRGGDCAVCPAGSGGNGGPAEAAGGNGGNASGNGDKIGGNGGAANATGGQGGNGADCCVPVVRPGGNGGPGGNAISTAGKPGQPGGVVGANATKGGDGGDGGEGEGPGAGGKPGTGRGSPVNIPDGAVGAAGLHCSVTPTPTPTTTPAPPTPKPPFIITVTTDDGFHVTCTGPSQAQTGGTLKADCQITTPAGQPARGTFPASLGDPLSDPRASHTSGELDAEGKVTLFFDVNWPPGTTRLWFTHLDKVYEVTEITIAPVP